MADPMIPNAADLTAFVNGTDDAARIAAATADVRSECGWHVAPSLAETQRINRRSPRSTYLWVRSLLVTGITEIRDPDGVVLDPLTYDWSPAGAVWLTTGCWRGGVYDVDLVHGYTAVPEDLRDVILARAARAKVDPTGRVAAIGRGPFSEQYNTGGVAGFDPVRERNTVARYRIPETR